MTFKAWFKKQFGFLPMPDDQYSALSQKKVDLRDALAEVSQELRWQTALRDKWQAASYAWNCKDSYKKGRKP